MATARLIPSSYSVSNSSYLSVSNPSNMYENTDSDTYATVTNSQTGTTSYYIYIRGFNFSAIPSNAVVSSFTVKLKVRESGVTTSTSYHPYLVNNTSTLTCSASMPSTSVSTITFTGLDVDWDDIVGYGSNFGIRINARRASRNTTGYLYIYGAEIEVEYSIPIPRSISVSLTGDGTVSPSGTFTKSEGEEVTVTITPTNVSDPVSATRDGNDISADLVAHYAGGELDRVLGTYSLVSGGFNGSGASYFQGLVGKGHTGSQTTTNYYSSGSNSQAIFQYDMSFDNIPLSAVIDRVYALVNGHAESTSQSQEYMCAQLISGSKELSEELNFKSVGTSNSTETLEATTLPTVAELSDMKLQCKLGYYGGAINGATAYVVYHVASDAPEYYTYTFITDGDTTIAFVIGSVAEDEAFVKIGGSYVKVLKVFSKTNDSYTEVADMISILSQLSDYILE